MNIIQQVILQQRIKRIYQLTNPKEYFQKQEVKAWTQNGKRTNQPTRIGWQRSRRYQPRTKKGCNLNNLHVREKKKMTHDTVWSTIKNDRT